MLYLLGAVRFEVWPVNAEEVERETSADFAEKPVIGRRPDPGVCRRGVGDDYPLWPALPGEARRLP